MGNNSYFGPQISESTKNIFLLFSKDPAFENYYFSNKHLFNRVPSLEKPFLQNKEKEYQLDGCLSCRYLKKENNRLPKNADWISYIKSECKTLKKNCIWTKKIKNYLKTSNISEMNLLSLKYVMDIYYIDYKTRIMEEVFETNKENKELLMSVDDNSPIIKVNDSQNDNEFLEEKFSYSLCTHYKDNMCKLLDYNHENQRDNNSNNKKPFTFLNNNTLISQNKIFDIERDNNTSFLKKTKNLASQHFFCLNHYKLVTNKIENHLKQFQENHPLAMIKEYFIRFFINTYGNFEEGNKDFFKEAVFDLQQIIRIMSESLFIFYKLTEYKRLIKNFYFFTKENVLAFVSCVFFNEKNIYEILFSEKKKLETEFENKIEKNLKLCYKWGPEKFGVSPKYLLSDKTIDFFIKSDPSFSNLNANSLSLDEVKDVLSPLEEPIEITGSIYKKAIPFFSSVETLQKVANFRAPIHKLKIISIVHQKILENIKDFYRQFHMRFDKKFIETDEMVSILMYIISKSSIPYLYSQCLLLELFLTNEILNSISNYYLTNIKAALKIIGDMEIMEHD